MKTITRWDLDNARDEWSCPKHGHVIFRYSPVDIRTVDGEGITVFQCVICRCMVVAGDMDCELQP